MVDQRKGVRRVWKVYRKCVRSVWKVCWKCLVSAWKYFGKCQGSAREVSGGGVLGSVWECLGVRGKTSCKDVLRKSELRYRRHVKHEVKIAFTNPQIDGFCSLRRTWWASRRAPSTAAGQPCPCRPGRLGQRSRPVEEMLCKWHGACMVGEVGREDPRVLVVFVGRFMMPHVPHLRNLQKRTIPRNHQKPVEAPHPTNSLKNPTPSNPQKPSTPRNPYNRSILRTPRSCPFEKPPEAFHPKNCLEGSRLTETPRSTAPHTSAYMLLTTLPSSAPGKGRPARQPPGPRTRPRASQAPAGLAE